MPVTETETAPRVAGVDRYLAEFERFQRETAAEPAGLREMRRAAIERFASLGFPNLRQEEWRLTNVAPIVQGTFHRPESDPDSVSPSLIAPHVFDAAARLVFVDGRFSARLSQVGELPAGTVVASLAEVLAYASSKSGVLGLVRGLCNEWAPLGIRVNAIAPGVFPTDLNRPLIEGTERGRRSS